MGKIFFRTFYHIVWSTKCRYPFITDEVECALKRAMADKAKALKSTILEIGMAVEHCHVVAMIHPSESVSSVVGALKGYSSFRVKRTIRGAKEFDWQDGFAVFTLDERQVCNVTEYVRRQRVRHRQGATEVRGARSDDEGTL